MAIISRLALAIAIAIGAIGSSSGVAIAAPVPTPGPGNGSLLSAPTPNNPVDFNFQANTPIVSAQTNTNNYKIYSDMAQVTAALNGCSFVPGAAISTVTVNSPVTGTITPCVAGTGNGATLTLGLSITPVDTVSTQTIGGNKTFSAPVAVGALTISGTGITATGSDSGLDLGFNSKVIRRSSDGALVLSSQSGVVVVNGSMTVNTGNVAPLLTPNGLPNGSNSHTVFGTCSSAGAASCDITFSNGSVFASAATYACGTSAQSGSANPVTGSITKSGTVVTLTFLAAGTNFGLAFCGGV